SPPSTVVHVALPCFVFSTAPPPDLPALSLHDALPICRPLVPDSSAAARPPCPPVDAAAPPHHLPHHRLRDPARPRPVRAPRLRRSEEHTSELQSLTNLVCRLLLEQKN